jgi:hypothetical protein
VIFQTLSICGNHSNGAVDRETNEVMENPQSHKRVRGSGRRPSAISADDQPNVMTPKVNQKDSRTTEQRVLDSHCTFQPFLVSTSHKKKPNDKQLSDVTDGSNLVSCSRIIHFFAISTLLQTSFEGHTFFCIQG